VSFWILSLNWGLLNHLSSLSGWMKSPTFLKAYFVSLPVAFSKPVGHPKIKKYCTATISLWSPLRFYRIYLPTFREYFVDENFVELHDEICKAHPPWAIRFLCLYSVFDIFFNGFIFLPIISFLTERSSPNTLISPRISQPDQF